MKKAITLILVLTLCVGLLVGCGGKNPTAGSEPEYVPIPDLTDPTETTEAPRRFDIAIADPIPVPVVATEKNITPDEFKDILLVENRSPFTSQFMECDPEEFERRYDVYTLGVTNISNQTIENLTLTYHNGERNLTFYVEMLPAGWTVMPMDTEGTEVTATELTFVSGEINYLTTGREVTNEVELIETRDGTIIVRNTTGEEMAAVVVYYRDVDYLGNVMAGRCFRATSMALPAGWAEELETDQWLPSCIIVNVVVLDEAPDDAA